MTKKEKGILASMVNHHSGLLYPAILPSIAKENPQEFHKLISENYIEETAQTFPPGRTVTCYRVSEKGHFIFSPIYKKLFSFFKGDIRTIIISTITTLVTILLTNLFD